jgi:predicted aspartyl protease
MRSRVLILGLALVLPAAAAHAGVAANADAAAAPPQISRPRPAPDVPANVLPLPPAVIDNTLTIGGNDVKAREIDTRLSVDVHVNGRGPYHFVVDSGADTSAVGLRMAHDLELPLGTPAVVNGMTSRDLVDRVKIAQLTVGATTVHNLEVPALRESDLGGDGLIGIDSLVEQRLMMDFAKHLIKVEDARTPVKYVPGEIVITGRRRRGQLILTAVRAANVKLDAVIDTGSEVTIGNTALRDKLLRKGRAKFWEVEAIGVTGVHTKMQMARIDELQLGPITLQDVPIAFADVPPFQLFGLADEPALLLGTDILENFRRVSLDFRSRKVRFQLRRCGTTGITLNSSPTATLTRLSSEDDVVCQR